jgi:D-alanine transaminase
MSRIAYVNGRFVPHGEAVVHIEDRGYQFGDAVYEVWAIRGARLTDAEGHFARLARSLGELRIAEPMSRKALEIVLRETVRRNRVNEGLVYLQISRGVAKRDHPFPVPTPTPAIVITAKSIDPTGAEAKAAKGVAVVTVPENRWGRCDIKTVNLLPNVLAKQAAKEAGAYEAWFVDELGFVSEGSSTNAWIIDREGRLRTRDIQANILRGVTRAAVLRVAAEAGLAVAEGPFSVDDALGAREAFITGASTLVTPVVRIDGRILGDGEPGPVAKRLRQLYIAESRQDAV